MSTWRLSALPRYLPTADVERLITSCDLTKPHGIRDKAILLLLARPGLRAGDRRFAVQVRELTPPTRTTVVDLDLEIAAAPLVQMDLDPRTVTAGKRGAFVPKDNH